MIVAVFLLGAAVGAAAAMVAFAVVRVAACTCGAVPGGRCVESCCPHRDPGRPVTPTSPMWPKPTARPEPGTRVHGSPFPPHPVVQSIEDEPPVAAQRVGSRRDLPERPDW